MNEDQKLQQALQQPLPDDQFRPVDLRLDRKDGLFISWADGRKSHFPLAFLRKNCPCATCREEREHAPPPTSGRSLTILSPNISKATEFTNAKTVGNYAIQIDWADGHRTGIYDFRFLRAISPTAAV